MTTHMNHPARRQPGPWPRLAALALALLCAHRATAQDDPFAADLAVLTQAPHRLAGTPEGAAAATYVAQRLRALGVDEVIVQPFVTTQTVVKRCEVLGADGRRHALLPCRPNGIIPPVTPPAGVSAELVDGGAGTMADFARQSPQGRIVVLDYNSGDGWLRAFRLGAVAVVFVPAGVGEARHPHYTEANANFLRCYYPGARTELPLGTRVTLHSEVVWQTGTGHNVYGFVRGREPVFDSKTGKEELVVVSASLDSFGEVPQASPGARGAANLASLLAVAQVAVQARPRRHLLLAALDQQARGYLGSSLFYRALETEPKDVKVEERTKVVAEEQEFVTALAELLALPAPLLVRAEVARYLDPATPAAARAQLLNGAAFDEIPAAERPVHLRRLADLHRDLVERIKPKAAEYVYELNRQLETLRLAEGEWRRLEREAKREPGDSPQKAQIDALLARKDQWNEFRRALGRDRDLASFRGQGTEIEAQVRHDVARRLDELAALATQLAAERRLSELVTPTRISLHVSLLLGDATPRWGLVLGGQYQNRSGSDSPGLYGRIQNSFLNAARTLAAAGAPAASFETASADQTLEPAHLLLAAATYTHGGEIAGRFGIYNLALATVQEALPREGTPDDTPANLQVARLRPQVADVARVLVALGSEELLSMSSAIAKDKFYSLPGFENKRVQGPLARATARGSSMANKPMPGVIIQLRFRGVDPRFAYDAMKIPGFDNFQVLTTDQNGSFGFGPVSNFEVTWLRLRAFAVAFDARGAPEQASNLGVEQTPQNGLTLTRCRHGAVVVPPQQEYRETIVLDANTNSALAQEKSYFKAFDGMVSWFAEEKVRAIKLFGTKSAVLLNNGPLAPGVAAAPATPASGSGSARHQRPPDEAITGEGLPVDLLGGQPPMALRAAADLWRLDEWRLDILRRRGVLNSSLEELHGRAEDLMLGASQAANAAQSEALATSSFLSQARAYASIRGMLDDLVHAVLILLALSVPFAFALERLLIGSTSIYRQIAWFTGLFVCTFILLFLTHPAFAIAKTPIVIFLGFAVIVLSGLVIVIIMRKFEVELKVLQGLESTVHAADVSRFGTVMAAMSMGISSMRRRPLRTALTAVTIILLTFTILCFASFGTQAGVITLFLQPAPDYSAAQVRQVVFSQLPPAVLDVVRGQWGGAGTVAPRYWLTSERNVKGGLLVTRADGSQPLALKGAVGLTAAEVAHRRDLAELLRADATTAAAQLPDGVWLTNAAAGRLGVDVGSPVLVNGLPLVVRGVFDSVKLAVLADMDDSPVAPLDFAEMEQFIKELNQEALAMSGDSQNWDTLPADSVVFLSAETAQRLGGTLRLITVYTADTQGATQMAEEMSRILPVPIAATRADGVYRHVFGARVQASGLQDLLFPILLGGLVIFGTMLGSVTDREKEIYSFSALGLAPQHVAGLFFAEALVYAVIGGLGGYLLAQATTKVLGLLAALGLMRAPELNYSSMNAIVTILLVMGTVLVSAIYPALKASRSANPGIMRTWRLPAPVGDRLDLVFPFTVSEYDISGVVSFLKEHFDSYSDTGLGVFMAKGTSLVRGPDGRVGLEAQLALAPFDLGVTQHFALRATASEIAGIDEVAIRLERLSGQPRDWQRLNKVLLDDLRRQFLIWRSLPADTMEGYRQRTLTVMGAGAGTAPRSPPAPALG